MGNPVGPAQPHKQQELQENVQEVKELNAPSYIKEQNAQKEATLRDHSVEANPANAPSYAAFISSVQVPPTA